MTDIKAWIEEASSSIELAAAGECANERGFACANFECAWIGKCMKTFTPEEEKQVELAYEQMANDELGTE